MRESRDFITLIVTREDSLQRIGKARARASQSPSFSSYVQEWTESFSGFKLCSSESQGQGRFKEESSVQFTSPSSFAAEYRYPLDQGEVTAPGYQLIVLLWAQGLEKSIARKSRGSGNIRLAIEPSANSASCTEMVTRTRIVWRRLKGRRDC